MIAAIHPRGIGPIAEQHVRPDRWLASLAAAGQRAR
jgi:hypothetical protein